MDDLTLQRIVFAYRAAVMAANAGTPSPSEPADILFDRVAALDRAADVTRALDETLAVLEAMPPIGSYDARMILGELLAACLLKSADHDGVARRWSRRDHSAPRTVVARAWSRVADVDRARVDGAVLLDIAAMLDRRRSLEGSDEVTLGHVGLALAKLRDTGDGAGLIERLAQRGRASRYAASAAIAADVGQGPTPQYFTGLPGRPESGRPPSRRLTWLLAALVHDPDRFVAEAALQNARAMKLSWPDAWKTFAEILHMARSQPATEAEPISPTPAGGLADSAPGDRARPKPRTAEELRALTHADLARPGAAHGPGLAFNLRLPGRGNTAAGVLIWDPDLLDQDRAAEQSGAPPLAIADNPRLFVSYRWTERIDDLGFFDFVAGHLYAAGYDIVFDRDPRHLDKSLTAGDFLVLMHGCTHYVPIITDSFTAALEPPSQSSALAEEWALARRLATADPGLAWRPLWRSGDRLPAPLSAATVVDIRTDVWGPLDRHFPQRAFVVSGRFADGTDRARGPLRRPEIRPAIAELGAQRGCLAVTVRDVTPEGGPGAA